MEDVRQEGQAEAFKRIRDAVGQFEADIQLDLPDNQRLLEEAESKQGKIIDIINDKLHDFEVEKAKTDQQVRELTEKLDAAVASQQEVQKQAETAQSEKDALEKTLKERITSLETDLAQSVSMAEVAVRERAELQVKLTQFQENWEKYIESQ